MQAPRTTEEKLGFKNSLRQFCQQTIEHRIALAKRAIEDAQKSANNEEKSSAGDKYETSRAMSHLEKDMYSRQLAEHIKELAGIYAVDTSRIYPAATAGSFIQTSEWCFFLGAGLGKQLVDGEQIIFLSQQSPLAKQLLDKAPGDCFTFNGKEMTIIDVY